MLTKFIIILNIWKYDIDLNFDSMNKSANNKTKFNNMNIYMISI